MEKTIKLEPMPPRSLRYRSHYKIYLIFLISLSILTLAFWGYRLAQDDYKIIYTEYGYELWMSGCYFLVFGCFYFFWLRFRLNRSVQVFENHIVVNNGKPVQILFEDIESVGIVCWSLFYFKMKNGIKHYFNSSLERVDYIWEGINQARPELIPPQEFESFRTKLVQYDHHQKRKEWFFRHKFIDLVNWIFLPFAFLCITYIFQTRDVVVHQQGMYFFRLFMYSILILMFTTFFYSIVLKKFVFDKRIKLQMSSRPDDKIRDIEFEGIILHRSKIMQSFTAVLFFTLIARMDVNLFTFTKIREDLRAFNLKRGHTLIVDNRYNCLDCKYSIKDGDVVIFGKGIIGQIMATEGDMVGRISQDGKGRIIASENIQEVPKGHVAIRLANDKEIVMIKLGELIGKLEK